MSPQADSTSPSQLLARALLSQGLATREQLQRAADAARASRRGLSHALISQGVVDAAAILKLLSAIYKVPAVDVSRIGDLPAPVLGTLDPRLARKYLALPLRKTGEALTVAVADPSNRASLDSLGQACGLKIEPVVAPDFALLEAINKFYASAPATAPTPVTRQAAAPPPVPAPPQGPNGDGAAPDPARLHAEAELMMLNLDRLREEKGTSWKGKRLISLGVISLVGGVIAAIVSINDAASSQNYMVIAALFLVGGGAILGGFLTLGD